MRERARVCGVDKQQPERGHGSFICQITKLKSDFQLNATRGTLNNTANRNAITSVFLFIYIYANISAKIRATMRG